MKTSLIILAALLCAASCTQRGDVAKPATAATAINANPAVAKPATAIKATTQNTNVAKPAIAIEATTENTDVAKSAIAIKATKENPWENSLGMKFVPVPGTQGLFSIWDTRVQDFEKFSKETGYYKGDVPTTRRDIGNAMYSLNKAVPRGMSIQGATWKNPGWPQEPTYPVVGVSWNDAKAFCKWLTKKERREGTIGPDQEYRLPTDVEWTTAVGGKYSWGDELPPPAGFENFAGSEAKDDAWPPQWKTIPEYHDDYPRTSPVGSFKANRYGLFDMSGNVRVWSDNFYKRTMHTPEFLAKSPYYRNDHGGTYYHCWLGGSWRSVPIDSAFRDLGYTEYRYADVGFRCVLATVSPATGPSTQETSVHTK